jgi:hypothetical protein
MEFLNREQIELLNYRECQDQLQALSTRYNLDLPLTECWEQVWPVLDEITNMILYLEDRIARFEHPCVTSMSMTA